MSKLFEEMAQGTAEAGAYMEGERKGYKVTLPAHFETSKLVKQNAKWLYWQHDVCVVMASSVALSEAQSRLGELMDRAESWEEIVIERAGRAGVKLVPVAVDAKTTTRRVGGQNLLGVTYIAPDFDAPMSEEELQEWGY